MTSIFQQALGADFQRLHPQIQQRFGFSSTDGVAAIGRGVMAQIWHGGAYTLPFLQIGAWRHIMFPEQGSNIPFTIENYAYQDALGRETVSLIRTFQTPQPRRFDAYMIYSPTRHAIVDYMGTHQHLAVDLTMWANEKGGLCIRSGAQRFYEGWLGFNFPLLFSGIADVCEWYDEQLQAFRIEVNVWNPKLGRLFGYQGTFEVEWQKGSAVPDHIHPLRIEART